MVFGEAAHPRSRARASRRWHLAGQPIQEVDEYPHLGVLRSVHRTTANSTSPLDGLPSLPLMLLALVLVAITSHKVYSALCLPMMLYGSEIWLTTKTLPIRCPSKAFTSLLGSRDIPSLISQRQLTFNSIAAMTSDDLPRQVLVARLANSSLSGIIPLWNQLLDS